MPVERNLAAGTAAAAARAAAARLPERIAFLGLGLIGGSIARAIREAGASTTLVAWTPEGRGPAEARDLGIVDAAEASAAAAVDGAGLVILAGPPLTILRSLGEPDDGWRAAIAAGATVTDVGSTKVRIVAAADAAGLRFVGGHPMAGRETTGVGASAPDLFAARPWVIVPGAHATRLDVERVENLATAAGARLVHLGAEEHDAAVAAVSHAPLVLSAALVEAVAALPSEPWRLARELAASGWRDMSRLAKGDPEMGAGILATNAAPVADRLRAIRDALDAWIAQLEDATHEGPDAEALRRRLETARAVFDEEAR